MGAANTSSLATNPPVKGTPACASRKNASKAASTGRVAARPRYSDSEWRASGDERAPIVTTAKAPLVMNAGTKRKKKTHRSPPADAGPVAAAAAAQPEREETPGAGDRRARRRS